MTSSNTFRVSEYCKAAIDGDGAVVLDLNRGTYFSLTGVAVDIWTQLERGASEAEIVDAIVATYDGPQDEIRVDVKDFIARAVRAGLVNAS